MKQSGITSKLQAGEQLWTHLKPKVKAGKVVLSVNMFYYVGKEKITKQQFDSVRASCKLSKDYDRSTNYIQYYKLAI